MMRCGEGKWKRWDEESGEGDGMVRPDMRLSCARA